MFENQSRIQFQHTPRLLPYLPLFLSAIAEVLDKIQGAKIIRIFGEIAPSIVLPSKIVELWILRQATQS